MKKQFLLSLLMILSLVANADPVEIDGIYYNLISKAAVAEVTSNPNYYSGDVVIPESVNYDGVDYSVTSIGQSAFASSISLTSVTIPNSVTTIGDFAFSYCSSLISVNIPDGVSNIGLSLFWSCSSLTTISIPNSVTKIEGIAFMDCTSLKSVKIPDGVTVLASGAFSGCTSLTSFTIPNSVTNIGDRVLKGCTGLTSVTIGSGIKEFSAETFANCTELSKVYCYAESVPNTPSDAFNGSFPEYITLYVPANSVDAYKTTTPWSNFKAVLALGTEPSEYTLSYVIDGMEYKSYKVEEGAAITPEPAPTKDGYTFSGWSEIPATMPSYDVTITGSFTAIPVINKYKLIYMLDGEVYKSYEIDEGTAITLEPTPTKDGYTFSGWSEIPPTMPAYDVTVIGSFTINIYNLTYVIDGDFYSSEMLEFGTKINPPLPPSKDGCDFAWSDYPETMPAYDLIIEGHYTTGIKDIIVQDSSILIYDIKGSKISQTKRGVYIIRKKNGETKKIVIK